MGSGSYLYQRRHIFDSLVYTVSVFNAAAYCAILPEFDIIN